MRRIINLGRWSLLKPYIVSRLFVLSVFFMILSFAGTFAFELPLDEIDQRIISDISVTGNLTLSEEDILKNVTLNVVSGVKTTIEDVRHDIESLYLLGYFKDVTVKLFSNKGRTNLLFKVSENPLVSSVEFVGNEAVSDDHLRSLIKTKSQHVFSYSVLDNDIEMIKGYYQENGYSLMQLREIDYDRLSKKVTFFIDEGYVNNVSFKGNSISDHLLVREMHLQKGSVFNSLLLRKDREKLLRLGYFSSVSTPKLKPSMDKNAVDIHFDVVERKINSVGLALEQGRASSIINTVVSFKLNNQLGMAESTSLRAQFGQEESYSAHYYMPWIGPYHVSLGLDRWYKIGKEKDSSNKVYSIVRNGGDIVLGYPMGDNIKTFLTYEAESVKEDVSAPSISYMKNSLAFAFSWDSRDSVKRPHYGTYFFWELERGGNFKTFDLGGISYSEFNTEASFFHSFIPSQVLALHAQFSDIDQQTNVNNLEYDLYTVGGTYSVRGYSEADAVPNYTKVVANAEYRIEFSDVFSMAVFYDMGSAYDRNFVYGNMIYGAGFGLRISTPLGPMRFDLAWPSEEDPSPLFHFGLAEMF